MNLIRKYKKTTAFFLLIAALWCWRAYDGHFTPQRWAKTDIDQRGRLVNSLLRQYDGLAGMEGEEVVALLGWDWDAEIASHPPTPDYPQRFFYGTYTLMYPVGGRPWAIFPEYLHVYLEDGRVTEAQLIAD